MAIAYAPVGKPRADQREVIVDITLDGSYASGGYALTNASLGLLANPDSVNCYVRTAQGFIPQWDSANNKLKMWKVGAAGPLTECVAGDLSSAVVVRCEVKGDPRL